MADKIDIRALAQVGAIAEHKRLTAELANLVAEFPDLENAPYVATNEHNPTARALLKRKRKRMSAAARLAIGVRMRRYWRKRRQS